MNKVLILLTMGYGLMFSGCASIGLKEYVQKSLNKATYKDRLEAESRPSFSPCVELWKKEGINKDYTLKNGNLVHVYPAGCGCLVHREFDKNSKILVGYRFEGEKCKDL